MAMGTTSWDYFLLVLVAALGVLQIAAASARLRGLLFFKWPVVSYLLGALALGGAFGWFFTTADREAPPILEGSQQMGLFTGAVAAAVFITFIISSLLNLRLPERAREDKKGVEALKHTTYFKALLSNFRWKRGRG